MICCYTTPGMTCHDGWCKIGYTERQTVEQRVRQQTHTANIDYDIKFNDLAKMMRSVKQVGEALKRNIEQEVIAAVEATDLGKRKKSRTNQITREVHQEINRHVEQLSGDFEREVRVTQAERDRKVEAAQTAWDHCA